MDTMMTKERTLKVTGHAEVSLPPDEVEILFYLRARDKAFRKAQQKVQDKFMHLTELVKTLQLPASALQTLRLETQPDIQYHWFRPNGKEYSSYCQAKLTFRLDQELLQRVLYELSVSVEDLPYAVSYHLREDVRAEAEANLLEMAAADARNKAGRLAAGLGTELGSILHVEYNHGTDFQAMAKKLDHAAAVRSRYDGVLDMLMPLEEISPEPVAERRDLSAERQEQDVQEGAQGSHVPQPIKLQANVQVEWSFA